MSLRVSGKHMEVGDAFKTLIEDRIDEALSKYFDTATDKPNRKGRIMLLNTYKPAYTAKNPFHCPTKLTKDSSL